ncbi:MAG: malic enzyme-like NAD(P)-binding protein [Sweet potato little leaf phytoplasma]|uniref:NAD(P)-dependent malic enzyme n=1 Tax=Candidatus Phytoplasma australasiaticum TaxID=2754999 RepID=UPI00210EF120|nr:malic enzyme-like NAD(P)-binding protein [Sweet potato little leaf phytoplasma]MDV3139323.1 malic enzyme-like NAD(P)-binding protein [Candidatus Phytoplasma australasiaticum]MDO7987244.1 NAD-dependent malic enzyme [Sweet potato little leaf phytoplasma]MDO8005396.1 NAD-dependent malic enzyme [Sweet potato little leaf phytoplasma]MDO8008689.1 NAD-dependent malic enzyme [Sweet potato little leaf phytoplasma]MDO8020411.1 NAD-dependent malic enzyme [Sweet potato little leaf phytoplasma]
MNNQELALKLHAQKKGKLATVSKVEVNNLKELALVYTPGVAEPCLKIKDNPEDVYKYTSKGNNVAVISNGTAVLGLGNIGALASIPVMEGKAVLLKKFANIDSYPICVDSEDPEEVINIISKISSVFGAINLEDIKAPECFEIEEKLKQKLSIPVFHDDQHGTAIAVAAGLINALKVVHKKMSEIEIVILGAGAAGTAIAKLLLLLKPKNIVLVDKHGAINSKDLSLLNASQQKLSKITNFYNETGNLNEIIKNKDVFIGVSKSNLLTSDMIASMNKDAIVFALANPVPEIMPLEAKKGNARIIATGRSDFPNQINNLLVFPGIFRGALDSKVAQITEEMKLAAVYALAAVIPESQLNEENILPSIFNPECTKAIVKAIEKVSNIS